MTKTRTWTINGDFTTLKPTGLARYARGVTRGIDRMISEDHPLARNLEVRLVAPRPVDDFVLENIPIVIAPEFNKPRLPQFWVQCQLPFHVRGGLLSFCNLAPVLVRRQIACIHDLHTFIEPGSYGRAFRAVHRLVLPLLGARAESIFTISEVSRRQLEDFNVARSDKVVVAFNGGDHARAWDPTSSRLSLPDRPYVLGLGQPQAYKNAGLFWKIAGTLDRLGFDIVLVGALAPEVAARFGPRPPNMHLLGRVSDDDFARALTNAHCFLFPSRLEGFGLPVVEAMTWDCPVIASDIPIMREVCENAALYADPDNPDAWAAAVAQIQQEPQTRAALRLHGRERVETFTWRNVAIRYLQTMQEMDRVASDAAPDRSAPASDLGFDRSTR